MGMYRCFNSEADVIRTFTDEYDARMPTDACGIYMDVVRSDKPMISAADGKYFDDKKINEVFAQDVVGHRLAADRAETDFEKQSAFHDRAVWYDRIDYANQFGFQRHLSNENIERFNNLFADEFETTRYQQVDFSEEVNDLKIVPQYAVHSEDELKSEFDNITDRSKADSATRLYAYCVNTNHVIDSKTINKMFQSEINDLETEYERAFGCSEPDPMYEALFNIDAWIDEIKYMSDKGFVKSLDKTSTDMFDEWFAKQHGSIFDITKPKQNDGNSGMGGQAIPTGIDYSQNAAAQPEQAKPVVEKKPIGPSHDDLIKMAHPNEKHHMDNEIDYEAESRGDGFAFDEHEQYVDDDGNIYSPYDD